jgi:hypothetical protein
MLLAGLELTPERLAAIRRGGELIRERAGGSGTAVLTNALNIGIGRRPR